MQLIQEAKYTKQKERELNKIKKLKMASIKNLDGGDQSDEEPPSPELLEMSEDYHHVTSNSSKKDIDVIKKGNVVKTDITTTKKSFKDNGKKSKY